jgi:hypothetical protein
MIRQSTYTPLLALLGVAATLAVAYAQRPARAPERPRFVLTEREAFLLAPAELVAAPTVRGAVWSSNGRYVLAIRHDLGPIPPPGLISSPEGQPPPGEVSLVLWNRAARRSREVWKKRAEVSDVKSIAWLPGTNVALAEVAWIEAAPPGAPRQEGMPPGRIGRRTVLRLDAAGGVVSALPITEPTEQLFVSPAQPLAVLLDADAKTARLIRASGGIGPPIRVPKSFYGVEWSRDGRPTFVDWEPAPEAANPAPTDPKDHASHTRRMIQRWYALDPASGVVRLLPASPERFEPAAQRLPVMLRPTTLPVREGETRDTVRPLWLESAAKSEASRAMLCGDSEGGSLARDGSAALYVSQGAAWVTPFLRLPRDKFLMARRAALRAMAISNAKQVGTALMMYIQDYDETYPPAGDIINRLMPYVKNGEVFNNPDTHAPGFVYLYDVNTLASVKEPATTPVGHLTGPGGRAIIYADGHVVWEDEKAGNK